MAAAACCITPSGLEQRTGDGPEAEEWQRAEDSGGQHAQTSREPPPGTVQSDFLDPRQARRTKADEQPQRGPGDSQTEQATGKRQQRALSQEIARDAAVAGSERTAYR